MKAKFWHERWESGQLGFHQEQTNPTLMKCWQSLGLEAGTTVFVPLCGKSLDMDWLERQGHPVIGIELSPIALRDYFASAGLSYSEEAHGDLRRWKARGYELFCGDFFDLDPRDLDRVRGVYDRASLIALPEEMRERYAKKMVEIIPRDAKILLISLEYDQAKMSGPPHSVPPGEVEALFGDAFDIEALASSGKVAPHPRFQERGLDLWEEHVFLLRRRSLDSTKI